jgi:hypothetical protein
MVTPLSTHFSSIDESWAIQCDDLWREIAATILDVRRVDVAEARSKGAGHSWLIALGGSGAIYAMVTCFRLWLERDRSRQIELTWRQDGTEGSIVITGNSLSAATVEKLVEAVAHRIEE